jgi:hypothetical protein
MIIFCDNIT